MKIFDVLIRFFFLIKIHSQNHQGETIPEPEFNQFAEFPWLHFPCTRN